MTKYRIKHIIGSEGEDWFLAQKRFFILWCNLYPFNKFDSRSSYFRTLEGAKEAIKKEKAYKNQRHHIVWEDTE